MKLTQSLVAIAALGTLTSTLSFAGGDINPVTVFEQEVVSVPVTPVPTPKAPPPPPPAPKPKPPVVPVVAEPLGIYLAGGVTAIAAREAHDNWANVFSDEKNQDRQIGFTARLGYDFMDYLGAELRGTYGVANTDSGYSKFSQFGAYLKPNYDITDELNLYALLGASKTNTAGLATNTGFSYGGGLDYGISDNISVFTDMVNYIRKNNVPNAWGLTLGAGYQF